MHTMAEDKIDNALEVKRGNSGMQKRRLGLPFAGYSCNHVKPNGGTWHDTTSVIEKMNCTQQYVSKVLKGRENLSLETLCKIENALGIKILQAGINK